MEKIKYFSNTKFPSEVIEAAHDLFLSKLDTKKEIGIPSVLRVSRGNETWNFDSREEFLTEYVNGQDYCFDHISQKNRLRIYTMSNNSVCVLVESPSRQFIEAVFHVFEKNLTRGALPESPLVTETQPSIFIGHGRDSQWRDLKDHLHEKHGLSVEAYEIGPRAGMSVKEVLQQMLEDSSFAVLVLTAEDMHTDGEWHARENVIHEVGLFQGSLGFEKAIILLEEGVKEFSNILGINQIRFPKGAIRQTFGDVLAVIRREFERK